MDIIEIAKEYAVAQQVAELETAYYTFTEPDLREFAQRIEQPHKQRIAELEAAVDRNIKFVNAANEKLNAKDRHIKQLEHALELERLENTGSDNNNPYENSNFWSNR